MFSLNLFIHGLCTLLQAPGGHELHADYWELIGSSPAGGAEGVVTEDSHVDQQMDQRHLMLRGETVSRLTPLSLCCLPSFTSFSWWFYSCQKFFEFALLWHSGKCRVVIDKLFFLLWLSSLSFRDHYLANGYVEVSIQQILCCSVSTVQNMYPLSGDPTHACQDPSGGRSYIVQT